MLACARPGLQPGFVLVPRRASGARVPSAASAACAPALPGPLQLNPQPVWGKLAALAPESLCAVSTGELPFPVWKEKLQCTPIFLSNSGIDRFLESKRKAQPGPAPQARDDGQLTNNN